MANIAKNKVLIITYYWPPAGGPGVQRVLKFVKYLPENGWEPIILTVKNGEYPAIDESLVEEVPESTKVYYSRTIEFYRLFKLFTGRTSKQAIPTFELEEKKGGLSSKVFSWIRSNLFVPDARKGWKNYAVKKALEVIQSEQPDIIFSSSPPHSLQLIARAVKKKTKLPWVADFRDPWVDAFWESGEKRLSFARKKNQSYEKSVFSEADHIVTTTESFAQNFKKKYASIAIDVITNGFDITDFEKLEKKNSQKFRIVYTGSIAPSQMPVNLFKALSSLPEQLKQQVVLDIFGVPNREVYSLLSRLKLTEIVQLLGYVDHKRIVMEMKNADLLLLLIPQGRGDIIPGKLFEYLATGNEILCLGPRGDSSDIIVESEQGVQFEFDKDISNWLHYKVQAYVDGNEWIQRHPNRDYSRTFLTNRLAKIFDRYVSK